MAKRDEYSVVATERHAGRESKWSTDVRTEAEAKRVKESVERTGGYPKGSTAQIKKR